MKIHQHTRTHKGLCHTTDPVVGHSHVPVLIFFFRLIFLFSGTLSFYWILAVQEGGIPGMIFLVHILKSPHMNKEDLPCSHSQKFSL